MKKFITLVIACALALAASARSQQNDDQQTKKRAPQEESAAAHDTQPNSQSQRPAARRHLTPGMQEPAATTPRDWPRNHPGSAPQEKREQNPQTTPAIENPSVAPVPPGASDSASGPVAAKVQREKPDVQKIKARHANFHGQPKPQQIPPVAYDESHRIKGSEHWEGDKYAAYRSYHPHRHNERWYRLHYRLIILVCGGYYYWDNCYWYPAWGYSPSVSYYVYDGPIYTGTMAEPPDQVIADVQASLQDLGYYEGEVDGLLGPSTTEALAAYQADNGLYETATVDQATLESLGLG